LNENLIFARFAEEKKAAVAQRGDPRQGRFNEPAPIRLKAARLDAEFFGAAEHFRHTKPITEAVTDLCGIGTDTVEAQ
jgi:hypothetical protein